jgi:outer membrane lipoprotein-sorting protein
MGGPEALAKIESSSAKLTAELPGMGEMKMDLYSTRDGKFLIKQIMPNNMGEFTVASDGTNGWVESPTRPSQLLGTEQVTAMREQITSMLGPIQPLMIKIESYPKMEVLDRVPYEGEESYKLKLTDADGNERLAFFSAATGLMRGTEVTQDSPMGQISTTLNFHEWTDKDGIKVPMKRTMDQMGMSSTMTLTEVEFNKVDPAIFQPSDAIKQMLSDRDNPAPPAAPPATPAPPASKPAPPPAGNP